MKAFRSMLILCILTLTFAACDRTEPIGDSLDFATTFGGGTVEIQTATDTLTLGVEIAESDDQRRVGLMRRTSLAPDSGMIFLFQTEQAADGVFWMYQTLVPLSIAFIGADGTIGSIRDMEPCPSPYPQYCPNYEARVPFLSALEVNRGWFLEHGVAVGDRVVLTRN